MPNVPASHRAVSRGAPNRTLGRDSLPLVLPAVAVACGAALGSSIPGFSSLACGVFATVGAATAAAAPLGRARVALALGATVLATAALSQASRLPADSPLVELVRARPAIVRVTGRVTRPPLVPSPSGEPS